MQKEKHPQACPIDVKYCVICGHAIKGEPLKDRYGNLYDEPFCYDLSKEVVE